MRLRISSVAVLVFGAGMLLADTRPGWLGFGFTLNRNATDQWLRVRTVAAAGPAEKAGLKPDDLIVAIDGKKLDYRDDLAVLEALALVKARQTLTLGIARADKRLRVRVTAGEMSDARYERWQLNLIVAKRKRAEAR